MVCIHFFYRDIYLIFRFIAEDTSRPSSPAPAPEKETPSVAAARDSTKSKGSPAARGGKYYQRGGTGTKSGPREGAGNLNQNGVEEPVGKKCSYILLYFVFMKI